MSDIDSDPEYYHLGSTPGFNVIVADGGFDEEETILAGSGHCSDGEIEGYNSVSGSSTDFADFQTVVVPPLDAVLSPVHATTVVSPACSATRTDPSSSSESNIFTQGRNHREIQQSENGRPTFLCWFPVVLMVMIAVVALIVGLSVVLLRDDDKSHQPANRPSNTMTENELFSVLRRILREHSSSLAFLDARSPEALALSWLVTAEQDPTLRIWDIDKDQTLSPRIIQRYALVVLALSCGGDSWRGVSPWMTQSLKNECDWSLVSCNEQNQVIKLDLEDTDMTGTLPDEISLLTSLVILRLSNNRLKGKLPLSVYSRLTTLEELVVLRNSLSFSIPSEIGLLSNLQALLASQNLITGTLPGEFKLLSNLVVLDLSGTQIEGPVFDFLPYLPRAEYLFIGQTLFSGMIPTDPTAMPSIRYLDVTGLPDLRTIPSTIASLTNLEVLRFGASWRQEIGSMTGTIPSEIGLLSNLVSLIIDDTEIKGTIPSELGNMREVQILGLANNQLTGEIPSTFGNLTKLNELYLYNNKLFGELPTELASLPNLRLLQVYANEAALVIPNNFCESLELKIIYDCEQSCDCCTSGSVGECIDNDGT